MSVSHAFSTLSNPKFRPEARKYCATIKSMTIQVIFLILDGDEIAPVILTTDEDNFRVVKILRCGDQREEKTN